MAENFIDTEVIYASADREYISRVRLPPGSTFADAIKKSRLLEVFRDFSLETLKFGSYGKMKKPEDVITSFDRVEIYRPITADVRSAVRSAGATMD